MENHLDGKYAWQEYLQWQKEDEKILEVINGLVRDIKRDPFKGLGKPEPLKDALQGWLVAPHFRRTSFGVSRFWKR